MSQILDNSTENENNEVVAERIEFLAELVWETIPKETNRAKPKHIIAEIAENDYFRNREKYTDAILTQSPSGDWWVRAGYIRNHWSQIKDYLIETERCIPSITKVGVYGTSIPKVIVEDHERSGRKIKKTADRLSYRGQQYQKVSGVSMPIIVTEIQKLPSGK